jgi:diguanylate cyclase (GGDEF)-like protein
VTTTTAPPQPPTAGLLRQLIEDLARSHDDELAAVARLAAALLGTPVASVNAVDGDWMRQLATVGFPSAPAGRVDTPCVRVLRATGGEPFASADLAADPELADSPWVDGRAASFRGYASAPLLVEGAVVGALCVVDLVPHPFDAADLANLADLALLAGAVLERRAAHAELSRAQAYTDGLLEVLPVGVVAVDADGRRVLVNGVTRRWHDESDSGTSTVATAPTGTFLRPDGVTPMPREELPLLQSLRGSGIAHSQAVLVHPGRPPRRLSITSSPIHGADGALLGSVAAMTDVTHQCELEERLRTAALHDALTGLPNRSLLMDRLDHALRASTRDGTPVAVLFCDLDGFKAVNDTFGHQAGDAVLVESARRLAGVVRPGDTVARLGGDEFVLLCPGAGTAAAVSAITTRIEHALRAPVVLAGGQEVGVGVSVGSALSVAGDGPGELLDRADEVMYAVKQEHHGRAGR